jgi:hypothetical protein
LDVPRASSWQDIKGACDLGLRGSDGAALSVSEHNSDVSGGQSGTSDGELVAIGENLSSDLRCWLCVDVVTVEVRADTFDAVDLQEDLWLGGWGVEHLHGDGLEHEVFAPLLFSGAIIGKVGATFNGNGSGRFDSALRHITVEVNEVDVEGHTVFTVGALSSVVDDSLLSQMRDIVVNVELDALSPVVVVELAGIEGTSVSVGARDLELS